jgi:predicted helicase
MSNLTDYLHTLERDLLRGTTTERSHYPTLKTLIESLAKGISAINDPKRVACGAPDFVVSLGDVPLGYIECKDVGEPLDKVERGEQMARYFSLGNVLLTDFLEFRWYVLGKRRLTSRLASVGAKDKLKPEKDGAEQVDQLLKAFIDAEVPTVGTPKELAERMAARAQIIRDAIRHALEGEERSGSLHQQMEGFRKVLLHDLTVEQFADMYAQSLCYGLFAARCNHASGERFTREHAAYELPKTNPFLRKMFGHIAGPDLDEHIVWAVDDLAELLNRADMSAILKDFGKRTRREDPVVHFYETFLAEYDSKMRESRGVYYTPEPVVSYIVRSVDHLLRTDFGLPDGLADAGMVKAVGKGKGEVHKVLILDPACGTGTFLYDVVNHIFEHQVEKGQKGAWSGYVSRHLLPRLFGFELLMAPYAVAHMKLGMALKDTGYDFKAEERLRVYLTNTLEEARKISDSAFTQWLTEEAGAAAEVKKDFPVMVVMGNPPYSGHSANKGPWITALLRGLDLQAKDEEKKTWSYFEVDGKPLDERNPKYLLDDYVKFIRFAQWRIEQTGYGILSFITNHSYFDNPTFPGMRQSLMRTFDDIYLLDLHGNAKKKEKCPDGSKDENVFDIQQGVAIGIFVKRLHVAPASLPSDASVRHADLYGLREVKYKWLGRADLKTTEWEILKPQSPNYLFTSVETSYRDEYYQNKSITEIFTTSANGFKTHRDHFAVAFDIGELSSRINTLLDPNKTNSEIAELYGLSESAGWSIQAARKEIGGLKKWSQFLIPCLYRPFDFRFCFFGPYLMDRPRVAEFRHVMFPNLCLAIGRQGQVVGGDEWNLITVGRVVADTNLFYRGGIQYFPLYLYPRDGEIKLTDPIGKAQTSTGRRPSFTPDFVTDFTGRLKMELVTDGKGDLVKTFGPEDVFDYMYAVFHSPTFRSRYAEFLKTDFPRLPLTSNPKLFRDLCALGEELVALHLMEKHGPEITAFPVKGDDVVERVEYTCTAGKDSPLWKRGVRGDLGGSPGAKVKGGVGRVWINKTQYFERVPPEVWSFHIGGYQVCHKWLKDRKGRKLEYDDTQHYQHIVSALSETISLMAEIDKSITQHGGWPIR